MFCIKGAGLEKTSLAKVVGIFNKVKENKKFEPGNTRETPGKHPGNTHETPRKGAFTMFPYSNAGHQTILAPQKSTARD